ncbi:MAG: hypothetical protein OK474_08040 [Thaumarchaeota archaeon]|nr:hypothetical protein [Nitrososphaerota archaeon]
MLGEGSFVLAVSEGTLAGKHSSFYDLFKVENGKIAEQGHDRDDPSQGRVEELKREILIFPGGRKPFTGRWSARVTYV